MQVNNSGTAVRSMDVTFNNVLEGKVRQYFLGVPKPAGAEGAGVGAWPAGAPPSEGAPAQSGAPAPSSRPPSAAAAPPATPPPALPPRPPDDPIEPEAHIIHKATVMREAAEKRREQPDLDDDEPASGALSPPSHIIRKPPHALPSPSPAPASALPCPSPARAPSPALPPPPPASDQQEGSAQFRPPAHRVQTPTSRPPDPYAPSRPPDPYSSSRPPEQYGRYYEASVADGGRTSSGPIASPQPSIPARHSPQTYARISSSIGSVPQHAASRLRESAAHSPPAQRYAMPPAQPPPPHNDRVPPIHHPQATPPTQRLSSADARSSHTYPPQQRRETSPYARMNSHYDRQPAVPTRKYDPQQAYSGYRPSPTTPQILSNHRVDMMQQQIQYKQAAIDALTAEYSARVAERAAPSLAPPVGPEPVRIPPRIDYPPISRTVDSRSGYHYPTPSTSRYASNVPAPSAPSSTLQTRTPYRMAAAPKPCYNYPVSPSIQTSPARSTVKPGYPNQKAKPTISVTSLYNEIKSKREPPASVNQSKQKRESPLDLSVKTVKNSADSSTTQDDAVDSASAESKILPLQPRPSSIIGRHPHMPAINFAASHKVDFAPNFNQYGERSTSQGYGSVPQQSHPPVRYNGAYENRRPVPEAYTVESPHQVYQERSKYGIPVARAPFVPKIDLTRPVADQCHPERIRDDRNFLIEERKRPAGPIVSNIPEKMVRYETWSSDSRIEQRMSQSAREQHELMNQPVYSYTSHKQLEAYQNEQKAKLFSSSSMYRQNHPQGSHRYPSTVYPAELHARDVPPTEYHPHYPDRNIPLNNRHHVIQKIPSLMREKDAHLHHSDPHSRVPAKQSVLSILRNSLETKQTGFIDPTRSVKPDIIVIDDADDPVVDITDLTKENDHEASIPKPFHNHLPGPASPSFGNHIKMPKAVDSIPRDSEYQQIDVPEVKVRSPENDVASRIRTKAELKSMPPSQDNTMRPEIKQSFLSKGDKQAKLLPKSQKQHLFNQIREDLWLESVIKVEKPSEPITPEVKSEPMNIEEIERDAVITVKTENTENYETESVSEDFDWTSACDNFMEQLKTGTHKKKSLKRRMESLDTEKCPQIDTSQKIESLEPSCSDKPLPEIKLPAVSCIPTDIVIKQEPMDDVINEDIPATSSLPEREIQKILEDKLEDSKHDSEFAIEKKLDSSKKHDSEKTTKIKQKVKAKPDKSLTSSTTPVKKETKESKDKIIKERKEVKGKANKEIKNNKEKVVKEIKEGIEKIAIETNENKEKLVIKTVIKEEQESTDDDEPLIKSKIIKEKEESERLKYQLLKDFTEKSAYVKLECCDVDVNKNNRKSLDSLTKEKDETKPNKGKLSKQLSRSKTKSLSIDNNKNDKQDAGSSSESDDDLCVARRLRIRKSIKGEDNKSTPTAKTQAKSSPCKKLDNSSASNSSTPVRKPGFGDGSDFHPGWEEELFRYKRSLRMPTRLIAIPRGRTGTPFMRGSGAFFTRGTTSLPDLDPVPLSPAPSSAPSAATDELYARLPDKPSLDSDLDSNSSYSAPNRLHYDSEASTSTIRSTTKAKKKGSSIVDDLIKKCGRKEDSKRKTKDREEKTPKIIAKSSNTTELLPTPSLGLLKNNIKGNFVAQKEKLEEDIFYLGAFRKETVSAYRNAFINNTDGLLGATEEFTPVVLKSRTRTESRIIRQRATIKEVFGDERPASAPPTSCRDDNYSSEKEDQVVIKKEPEETKPKAKPKKIVKGKIIRRSSSIRDGLRSTKLLKRNDAKGRLMRIKKRNSIMLSMNNKRMKEMSSNKSKNENSPSNNTDEKIKQKDENGSPVSVEGGPEVKKRFRRLFGRRKFSSGFDYIRKKKKIIRRDDQVAKVRKQVVKPSPESVIDIQKEIKSWFINKSIGETHLHRAARLGYTVSFFRTSLLLHQCLINRIVFNFRFLYFKDCVAYCLEKMEADPSAKDNAGFTPLHVASAKGHVRIARLLLQYGANVSAAAQGGIRYVHVQYTVYNTWNGFLYRQTYFSDAFTSLCKYNGSSDLPSVDEYNYLLLHKRNIISECNGYPLALIDWPT